MSQENVEAIRRIYDEVVDPSEATRALYDADYEMDLTSVTPDLGVLRGFEAANAATQSYFETFEDFRIEIEEVIHADEARVVTAVRDGGRMKGSDSEIQSHFFHVWTFRDGKVVRFSSHLDKGEALKAAEVSE